MGAFRVNRGRRVVWGRAQLETNNRPPGARLVRASAECKVRKQSSKTRGAESRPLATIPTTSCPHRSSLFHGNDFEMACINKRSALRRVQRHHARPPIFQSEEVTANFSLAIQASKTIRCQKMRPPFGNAFTAKFTGGLQDSAGADLLLRNTVARGRLIAARAKLRAGAQSCAPGRVPFA